MLIAQYFVGVIFPFIFLELFSLSFRLLKYEEKKHEDIKPLETQPTEIAEKELEYKTVKAFTESLKSEKTEGTYQDYYLGMLVYILVYGN